MIASRLFCSLCVLSLLGCDAFADSKPTPYFSGAGGVASGGAFTGGATNGGWWGSGGTGDGGSVVDSDFDGLPNGVEIRAGLSPNSPDSDSDGCSDYFDSAFVSCTQGSLVGRSACFKSSVDFPSVAIPKEARERIVRIEVLPASLAASSGEGGNAGASGGGASTSLRVFARSGVEEVFLLGTTDRVLDFVFYGGDWLGEGDLATNAANVEIAKFELRAIDAFDESEVAVWSAYSSVPALCPIP